MNHAVEYRSIKVDGLNIFYREAGSKNAPTLLLLHGLPSSSRLIEEQICPGWIEWTGIESQIFQLKTAPSLFNDEPQSHKP